MDSTSRNAIGTARLAWHALGLAIGTATIISLVKNGLSVPLIGIPEKMYLAYAWLRDALFTPMTWALSHLGVTMPAWLKDVVTANLLIVAAHVRALADDANLFVLLYPMKYVSTKISTWKLQSKLFSTLLWPFFHLSLRRLIKRKYAPVPIDHAREAYAELNRVQTLIRSFRKLLLLNFLVMIACALAFFLWNHISSTYGPPA